MVDTLNGLPLNSEQVDLLWDIKSLAYKLYGASYGNAECHSFAEKIAKAVDTFLVFKGLDPVSHVKGTEH